jgi:hypothetical protein
MAYIRPVVLWGLLIYFLLQISFLSSFSVIFRNGDIDFTAPGALILPSNPMLVIICTITSIVLLYKQFKENRIKQFSCLPVPAKCIGASLIISPVSLYVIFILALIISMWVDAVWPDKLGEAYRYAYSELFANSAWILQMTLGLCMWLLAMVGIGLFSERLGRLTLLILFFLLLGDFAFMPLINHDYGVKLAQNFWYLLDIVFNRVPLGIYANIALAMLFMVIIQISFLTRRSYLS